MKHVTGGICGPGPDRDRQKHQIHRGKTRHRQPHQQVAPGAVTLAGGKAGQIQLMRLKPQPRQNRDQICGAQVWLCLNQGAFQGQIDPRGMDAGMGIQPPLNRRDTGLTVDGWQG